ncbi:hypothetical protein HDU97_008905 [Phlyctochytrium planicorne]|nr:hypothetical protein HDU97_008905 [Phlyctochytrium planicorne]
MLQQVQNPIVTLFVSAEGVSSERRFNRSITILDLKERLSPITGVPASTMKLSVFASVPKSSNADSNNNTSSSSGETLVCHLNDEDRMLGFYPLSDFMSLQVTDTNPARQKGAFTDLSLVEKYEMKDEEYEKRQDSVLAYKKRNKIGRFADGASVSNASTLAEEFKEEASKINVGDRCQVSPQGGEEEDSLVKRGTVRFVGQTDVKPGYWVGIELDEPIGKHDGTVAGKSYFTCKPKFGIMVRPNRVEVGDFAEEDLFEDEL